VTAEFLVGDHIDAVDPFPDDPQSHIRPLGSAKDLTFAPPPFRRSPDRHLSCSADPVPGSA
jgi:hypothetical protein